MANSFTVTAGAKSCVGVINATGASETVNCGAGQLLDVSVDFDTNSFTGTIKLQRSTKTGALNVAEWQDIESYTASAEKVAQSAAARSYRLLCSAATTGAAEIEISAGATI